MSNSKSKLRIIRPLLVVAAAAAALPFASVGAGATVYQYTYQGNPFTGVNSGFTTSDAISFQFRSTGQLGANWNDVGFSAPISEWSLSVGHLSYSNADGVLYSINFSTNASAQITAYQFTTQTNVVAPDLLPAEYPPAPYEEEVFSFDLPTIYGVADGVYIPSIHQDSYYAYNSNSPGTWTIASVPEPSTWAMLLIGFAGLGFAGYRQNKSGRATTTAG